MSARPDEPLVRVENLDVTFRIKSREGERGARCLLRDPQARGGCAGRRIRFRQVDHRPLAPRPAGAGRRYRVRQHPHRAQERQELRDHRRAGSADAACARQRCCHDLPGADVVAEPDLPDRHADRGIAPGASAYFPARRAGRGAAAADVARGAEPREVPAELSAPAFRRHASARNDCHGAERAAGAPGCRRADDRAGCDDPGPDRRPAEVGAAGHRDGDPVRDPRSRPRGRGRFARARHVRGRNRRGRSGPADPDAAAHALHQGADRLTPASRRRASQDQRDPRHGAGPHEAARRAAAFIRAAPSPCRACATGPRPRSRRSAEGWRVRCHRWREIEEAGA